MKLKEIIVAVIVRKESAMVLERNYGAKRANDLMHQRQLEQANDSIEKKLDRVIALLEQLLEHEKATSQTSNK